MKWRLRRRRERLFQALVEGDEEPNIPDYLSCEGSFFFCGFLFSPGPALEETELCLDDRASQRTAAWGPRLFGPAAPGRASIP